MLRPVIVRMRGSAVVRLRPPPPSPPLPPACLLNKDPMPTRTFLVDSLHAWLAQDAQRAWVSEEGGAQQCVFHRGSLRGSSLAELYATPTICLLEKYGSAALDEQSPRPKYRTSNANGIPVIYMGGS